MSSKAEELVERTTITLTPKVKRRLEAEARNAFGQRKGYLSMYVEMIFRQVFKMTQKGVEEA